MGRALVNAIIDFTDASGYTVLRLVSSAMNMDSFSLYNRFRGEDVLVVVPSLPSFLPETG